MHKRKHRKSTRDDNVHDVQPTPTAVDVPAPDSCLYIQAYEADIIRGPQAVASARTLDCPDPSALITSGENPRSGLIRWGLERPHDTETYSHSPNQRHLWVDRYDVRLLLDHLPDVQPEASQPRPLSPSGWSDLPSDSEDTFFFSPDELQDYRREKRRRLIDRGREERLRALAVADGGQGEDPDPWGGSDEEPDEAQRELIRRTACHIISSPNPGQLEMRILANYGTDKRFAFLRGRWSQVWRAEKERVKQRQAEEARNNKPPAAFTSLGGLASYGDSDTDSEELEAKPTEVPQDITDPVAFTQHGQTNDDDIKEARRARAREWSAHRRAQQSLQSDSA